MAGPAINFQLTLEIRMDPRTRSVEIKGNALDVADRPVILMMMAEAKEGILEYFRQKGQGTVVAKEGLVKGVDFGPIGL